MPPIRRILVAAGLLRGRLGGPDAERVLITRRLEDAHLGGWWEFPGGKVEPGEAPAAALARELREELGIEVEVGEIFAVGHHVYAEREVILLVYGCRLAGGEPQCHGVAELRWVGPAELLETPLPPADVPVLDRLRREGLPA